MEYILLKTVSKVDVATVLLQKFDDLWFKVEVGELHRCHFERIVLVVKQFLLILYFAEKLLQTFNVCLV